MNDLGLSLELLETLEASTGLARLEADKLSSWVLIRSLIDCIKMGRF